jgi:hypothetical protein
MNQQFVSAFVFGQNVSVEVEKRHFKAKFAGVDPFGRAAIAPSGWCPIQVPEGMLVCVPMSAVRALPPKANALKATKSAQTVAIAPKIAEAVPKIAEAVPKIAQAAPKIAEAAVEEFPPLPIATKATSKVEVGIVPKVAIGVDASELEEEGANRVAVEAAHALECKGIQTFLAHTKSGRFGANFKCPAFTDVDGVRASIPFVLARSQKLIRSMLIENLGGVPVGTRIEFTYDFKRSTEGKLLDEDGDVRVFLKWR